MEQPESKFGRVIPKRIEDSPELKRLIARCEGNKIDCSEKTGAGGYHYLEIEIPAGRDKRLVSIFTVSHIEELLAIQFEQLRFLDDYLAICSYEEGTIEAEVEVLSLKESFLFDRDFEDILWSSFSGKAWLTPSRDSLSERGEYFSCSRDDVQISIGPITALKVFRDSGVQYWPMKYGSAGASGLMDHDQRGVSLKIKGLQIRQHDQAVDILERIANSVFFQIDAGTNVPLALKRQPPRWEKPPSLPDDSEPFELQFPRYEYDEIPMQLYWYGKKASGMPLLQFLAYYQVVESYFPAYSQAEALKQVQRILKNPGFRSDSDIHVAQILTCLQTHGGRGFGREKEQLLCTLQACVDKDTLRVFLSGSPERGDCFSGKIKGLKAHTIPINDPQADLRNAVADRIYQIRCRIVHTKGDSGDVENEPILPFSTEAALLDHDIALIQYVARQVLISASRALQF